MKNTTAFPITAIAFALGAFLPYIYMNGKIEETNSKMDDMMEHVNFTNDRLDYIRYVDRAEIDTNTLQRYTIGALDKKLFKLAIVQSEMNIGLKN